MRPPLTVALGRARSSTGTCVGEQGGERNVQLRAWGVRGKELGWIPVIGGGAADVRAPMNLDAPRSGPSSIPATRGLGGPPLCAVNMHRFIQ